tara:strand:+ start:1152 stop:1349 length:198 start_codon:yes stop_codon:yes gene_type:complete
MNRYDEMTKRELIGITQEADKGTQHIINFLENMIYSDVTYHVWYKLEAERMLEGIQSGFKYSTEA